MKSVHRHERRESHNRNVSSIPETASPAKSIQHPPTPTRTQRACSPRRGRRIMVGGRLAAGERVSLGVQREAEGNPSEHAGLLSRDRTHRTLHGGGLRKPQWNSTEASGFRDAGGRSGHGGHHRRRRPWQTRRHEHPQTQPQAGPAGELRRLGPRPQAFQKLPEVTNVEVFVPEELTAQLDYGCSRSPRRTHSGAPRAP